MLSVSRFVPSTFDVIIPASLDRGRLGTWNSQAESSNHSKTSTSEWERGRVSERVTNWNDRLVDARGGIYFYVV